MGSNYGLIRDWSNFRSFNDEFVDRTLKRIVDTNMSNNNVMVLKQKQLD